MLKVLKVRVTFLMIVFISLLTACKGEVNLRVAPVHTQNEAMDRTNSRYKTSNNEDFKAEIAFDIDSYEKQLEENEREALNVVKNNLTALVTHDQKLYQADFVNEKLADAMKYYYGEQFQYKFTGIDSIERNTKYHIQLLITLVGERLDQATNTLEDVKMMYAISKNKQGDWKIDTID